MPDWPINGGLAINYTTHRINCMVSQAISGGSVRPLVCGRVGEKTDGCACGPSDGHATLPRTEYRLQGPAIVTSLRVQYTVHNPPSKQRSSGDHTATRPAYAGQTLSPASGDNQQRQTRFSPGTATVPCTERYPLVEGRGPERRGRRKFRVVLTQYGSHQRTLSANGRPRPGRAKGSTGSEGSRDPRARLHS